MTLPGTGEDRVHFPGIEECLQEIDRSEARWRLELYI